MSTSGTVLNGRYHLASLIAAGGMGDVWQADDQLLGREVAIKVLRADLARDQTFRARFRAEARNTAALSHPGIAQLFDYGEQDDIAYLVMELVPGEPLSRILSREERLGSWRTLDIVAQTADALQAAHDAGIIHRDVKPANLMILPSGQVKVTDFGIARGLDTAGTLTQAGTVLGTARYVSPEQAEGRTLTPATDVYSLGIVAYECLSGRPPFSGETAVSIALAHVRDEPPPLPDDVPEAVCRIVLQCLAKDPSGRPVTAAALGEHATTLRDAIVGGATDRLGAEVPVGTSAIDAGAPTTVTPASNAGDTGDLGRVRQRRRRALMAAGIAGILVVFLGSLGLAFRWYDVFSSSGQTAQDGGPVPAHVRVTSSSPTPGTSSYPVANTSSQRPDPSEQDAPVRQTDPSESAEPSPSDHRPGPTSSPSPTSTPTPARSTTQPEPTPTVSESTPPTTPPATPTTPPGDGGGDSGGTGGGSTPQSGQVRDD